jgi:hypothetical protein
MFFFSFRTFATTTGGCFRFLRTVRRITVIVISTRFVAVALHRSRHDDVALLEMLEGMNPYSMDVVAAWYLPIVLWYYVAFTATHDTRSTMIHRRRRECRELRMQALSLLQGNLKSVTSSQRAYLY